MNRLTEEEVLFYIKEANKKTGVDGIKREQLEAIDLDKVAEIIVPSKLIDGAIITDIKGNKLFKYDAFVPRVRSYAFKPSFAGSQVLMGRVGRRLYFSNGVWFV